MRKYIFNGLCDCPLQIFGFNFSIEPTKDGRGFTATVNAKSLRHAIDFIDFLFNNKCIRYSFDVTYTVISSKGVTYHRILRNYSR